MLTSKIKNLIIYILLFVNLFLIALLASDWLQTRRAERTVLAAVKTILTDSGITMAQPRLPAHDSVKGYTVSRSLEQEEAFAEALLGRLSAQEAQSGNIMYYRGERGEAIFRGTGDFEVLLSERPIQIGKDTVDTARSLLRKTGLKGRFAPELSTTSGGTYTTVVMVCEFEGLPVVNGKIEFTFTSDALVMIVGTRLLDLQREDPSFRPLDSATLLTRFLGIVNRNGYVCNELREICPVYLYTPDASGGGKLTPVWRIDTDAGTFYLNMTTGEEQPVM